MCPTRHWCPCFQRVWNQTGSSFHKNVNKPFFIETYIWAVCDCMVLELHLCMLSVPIATKIASSFSLPRSILSIISVFVFGFLDNQHWLEQYNWYIIENSVEHPWTLNYIPWWWFHHCCNDNDNNMIYSIPVCISCLCNGTLTACKNNLNRSVNVSTHPHTCIVCWLENPLLTRLWK